MFSPTPLSSWSFWIAALALIGGLLFSILSWLELCVEHCSANQAYRLFGFSFGIVGILFFLLLNIMHWSGKIFPNLFTWTGWLIASALGAEVFFILVQKYEIGHWCPVCLTIALFIFIAACTYAFHAIFAFTKAVQQNKGEAIMNFIKRGLASLSFLTLGFLLAFVGISKHNEAEATMEEMKQKLAFGSPNSPVEVYIVSDWFCPSCKKIEPIIEQIIPEIEAQTTIYFIDYPIHKKSLNFTPYNLSFLINEKKNYLSARKALLALSDETETPSDEDIVKIAKKNKLEFKELPYLDVKNGIDFFDKVVEKYNLNVTPIIIVTNTKTKKSLKFEGRDEISKDKIREAVEKLK
ncbi:MAG: thioredoxin domain-containing protein [Parachlamydia sp.]|jgi:hypothetical protein|nr:thioredoxin domain-containing protein [Parachlamydia sp.]